MEQLVITIVGFPFLILIPGLLTILMLQLTELDAWICVSLSVAFSILELMLVALIGNMLLPFAGFLHPLDAHILCVEIFFLIIFLAIIAFPHIRKINIRFKRYIIFDNGRDVIWAFIPLLFILLAVAGAIQLNNGASDIFTVIMLAALAIYSFCIVQRAETFDEHVIPVALFFSSLSVLLMTSLRGTGISGHDIQREYYVFQLTKNNGLWSIANFRDAYNACVSITILPTLFAKLLTIADPYVYKVLFQIIFATVPGILYVTARHYVSRPIAYLSAFYFMAFPTFFADMPFLNRQEIAFLFLALMIYLMFDDRISLIKRRTLFLVLSIGMVISHYSTTYTFIAMLVFFLIAEPVTRYIGKVIRRKGFFSYSALAEFAPHEQPQKLFITFWMVACIAGAGFLWSSVLTNTASDSLYRVVAETFSIIGKNTAEDSHAGETSYGLLSWHTVDPSVLMENYAQNVVESLRAQAAPDMYYNSNLYEQYPVIALSGDVAPPTAVTHILSIVGINAFALTGIARQGSAKALQVLILIGFFSLLYTKRFFRRPLDTEYILLAIAALLLMIAMLVLPILSVEYGVLRAFQQGLMFLGLLIVIGSLTLFVTYDKKIQIYGASIIAIVFFLSTTGAFTQLFGGTDPQLSLNNSGLYYNLYYTHATEISGLSWLLNETGGNASEIQADGYSVNKLNSISPLGDTGEINDIYPALIRKDSYVFLNFMNVQKQQVTFSYNGTLLTYTYPLQFLADNKNLVYNNGGVEIYR